MRNADVVILENLFSLELPIHATVGSRNAEFGMEKTASERTKTALTERMRNLPPEALGSFCLLFLCVKEKEDRILNGENYGSSI